jgi:glutamine cyclotransferase
MLSGLPPKRFTYRVQAVLPHDPKAFTQGLAVDGAEFVESTGRYGESTLRRVERTTGRVVRLQPLDERYFGEGLAVLPDRIVQLTWREKTFFTYKKDTLSPWGQYPYPREGWGLTWDGRRLAASDGSAWLYFLRPGDGSEIGRIEVRDSGRPVMFLNELEYIEGEIWANVWKSDQVARIDPATGRVTGWIDLGPLAEKARNQAGGEVLNGIAYDPVQRRVYITGKFWPWVLQIDVVPLP